MNSSSQPSQSPKREIIERELRKETSERVSRIDREFDDGFKLMNKYNYTVSFFGSARFTEDHPYYQKARDVASALVKEGFTIVTGGGGGIMEAGDRGASENGGQAIGLNIALPHEQKPNVYATEEMTFRYFFSRKVILAYGADAYIFFPGGFGTLDELFEILTLIQTKKMPAAPVILYGSEFWTALNRFIRTFQLEGFKTISPGDEDLYTITEDIPVIKALVEHYRDITNSFTSSSQQ